MSGALFDPGQPVLAATGTSPDRARTERNRYYLKIGIHPLTRRTLLKPEGKTCGDCEHHRVTEAAKRYHKCDLHRSSGPATDIRVSWPACVLFTPLPTEEKP